MHSLCFAAPPGARSELTTQIGESHWIDGQRRERTGVTPRTGQRNPGGKKIRETRQEWKKRGMKMDNCLLTFAFGLLMLGKKRFLCLTVDG